MWVGVAYEHIIALQNKILERYAIHKRDLPWRDTADPYYVLVSEIMLQQTQVDRVVPKFEAFVEALPTFAALAEAPKDRLLSLWSGLGFNSRVLRLQRCAQEIVSAHNGVLPRRRELLLTLPGIGPYTSCSLLAFAYNMPVPVIDTNVRRVYIVELGLPEEISLKDLEEISLAVIPEWRANDRYNAVMDYGALVLTAKKTWVKPLSKQSSFIGSPRQARGKIVRHLIAHKDVSLEEMRTHAPHAEFDRIVVQLQNEGLIKLQWDRVMLAT